jgi:PadR family transcriptional regulator PadR
MRRKPGAVLPIELSIIEAALALRVRGVEAFYGYLLASTMREREAGRMLTAHGTLYKALDRMEKAGLLTSQWEDPQVAATQERPRRRLYQVTVAGEGALESAAKAESAAPVLPARAVPA